MTTSGRRPRVREHRRRSRRGWPRRGWRGRHHAHRLGAEGRDLPGVARRAPTGALDRLGGQPAGASTPWPSRTISIRRSTSVCAPSSGTSATSSRIELVPQSIAATRVTAAPPSATHGPARPPAVHPGDAASPNGFTPGPAASAWATSTCRHLTRSGMPPALARVGSSSCASRRRGSPRARLGTRRPAPGRPSDRPATRASARRPRAGRWRRPPRAGQVVQRRERACRPPAAARSRPRRAARRAAVRDAEHAPGRPAELPGHDGDVGQLESRLVVRPCAVAVGDRRESSPRSAAARSPVSPRPRGGRRPPPCPSSPPYQGPPPGRESRPSARRPRPAGSPTRTTGLARHDVAQPLTGLPRHQHRVGLRASCAARRVDLRWAPRWPVQLGDDPRWARYRGTG